nr:hypothetical protein [Ferrimicrobium acidiphilum]
MRGKNCYVMYGECGADGSVYADSSKEAIIKMAQAFGRTAQFIARHYEPFGKRTKTTIAERLSALKKSTYYSITAKDINEAEIKAQSSEES